jgi:hypothetical protein
MHYFFTSGKFTRPSAALIVVPRVLKPLIPFALKSTNLNSSLVQNIFQEEILKSVYFCKSYRKRSKSYLKRKKNAQIAQFPKSLVLSCRYQKICKKVFVKEKNL